MYNMMFDRFCYSKHNFDTYRYYKNSEGKYNLSIKIKIALLNNIISYLRSSGGITLIRVRDFIYKAIGAAI